VHIKQVNSVGMMPRSSELVLAQLGLMDNYSLSKPAILMRMGMMSGETVVCAVMTMGLSMFY